jgi:cytochrome c oxidase subunit 2
VESATPPTESLGTTKAPRRLSGRTKALLAALAAPLLLASCKVPSFGAHEGASKAGNDTFKLWQGFSIAALVIGLFTLALIVWAALRYRRRGDQIPKQTQYNISLEVIYTVVPIVIVIALFAATVVVQNKVLANPTPNATVNVTAFQWGWKFTYPGHKAYVVGQTTQTPELVMPSNEDVRFNLVSSDVVHGFYVPEFNFSRYAQPGLTNTFTFNIDKPGLYKAQCTQLCGLYHSLMYFNVRVLTPANYKTWLANKDASTSAADAAANDAATGIQTNPHTPTLPTKTDYGVN